MDLPKNSEFSEDYDHTPEIQAVRKNINELRDQLQPVTQFMVELSCFEKAEQKEIKKEEKEQGLCRASDLFLNLLVRKKEFWEEFIEALNEDGKEELAQKLVKDRKAIVAEEGSHEVIPDPDAKPEPTDEAKPSEEPMDETESSNGKAPEDKDTRCKADKNPNGKEEEEVDELEEEMNQFIGDPSKLTKISDEGMDIDEDFNIKEQESEEGKALNVDSSKTKKPVKGEARSTEDPTKAGNASAKTGAKGTSSDKSSNEQDKPRKETERKSGTNQGNEPKSLDPPSDEDNSQEDKEQDEVSKPQWEKHRSKTTKNKTSKGQKGNAKSPRSQDLPEEDNVEETRISPVKKPKVDSNISANLETSAPTKGDVGTKIAPQSADQVDKLTEKVKTMRISPVTLSPRSYQLELSERAKQGVNCMICAPTGCGKTFISIMIAENHIKAGLPVTKLDKKTAKVVQEKASKKRKVLFIVPTIVLVQQTYKTIKAVQPTWMVARKSGSHNMRTELSIMLGHYQVIVATAGAVANSLNQKEVSIYDLSLLLFDECHHAVGNNTYCQLLNHYLKAKQQNPHKLDSLPQIVGFTASPHVGNKNELSHVKQTLLKQCAYLCGEEFITVRKHLAELEEKVQKPTMARSFEMGRTGSNPFILHLASIMGEIQQELERSCPSEFGSAAYTGWLNELEKAYLEQKNQVNLRYCEHLKVYNKAIERTKQARMVDGFRVLERFYNTQISQEATDQKLLRKFQAEKTTLVELHGREAQFPNPKLLKVVDALKENLKIVTSNPFKGMVLVHEKDLAHALAEYIGDELPALNPAGITGENEGGMSAARTEEIIEQFRDGARQLLVATSVAEQGLDIPECRLMINYDYCKGLTSMVQARGRVRAKHGHQLVLGSMATQSRLHSNLRLELVLAEAINDIQRMDPTKYQKLMNRNQDEILRQLRLQEQEMALLQTTYSTSDVILRCRKCSKYLCSGSDLYRHPDRHIVTVEEAFAERVTLHVKTDDKSAKFGLGFAAVCNKCKSVVANLLDEKFYCLKAKALYQEVNNKWETLRQWKNVKFQIPDYQFFQDSDSD